MTILLIILLIVAALLFTPVSLCAFYDGEFKVRISVLFFKYTLSLDKKKEKKKEKPEKEKKTNTDNKKLLTQFSDIRKMLPSLIKRAFSALRVRKLRLYITVGSADPCDTALMYGSVNATVHTLLRIIENGMKVRKKDIRILADYENEKTTVEFDAVISTYLLRLIICFILLLSDETIDLKAFTKSSVPKENKNG